MKELRESGAFESILVEIIKNSSAVNGV